MKKILFLLMAVVLLVSCKSKSEFDYDLIPVSSGAKYGYIDVTGNYQINPQFDDATFFMDDLALVQSGGLWGYIDKKGNYVINPIYSSATVFSEGIAWVVKKEGAPVAIDKNGKELFTVKDADGVTVFSEGIALFFKSHPTDENRALSGFVNTKGEVVIPPIYTDARYFSEGLCAVEREEGDWGFINKNGEVVINFQFDDAYEFVDGRAIVSSGGDYGVIDNKGKYVINPQFDRMWKDGEMYIVSFKSENGLGWCDNKGKIVINPQFNSVNLFEKNALTPASISDKYGYINKKGVFTINQQFEKASVFLGDIAFVMTNSKWGAINKDGNYVINPQFSNVRFGEIAAIKSEFFDIESIKTIVRKLVGNEKLDDDSLEYSTNLSQIMDKYRIEESVFDANKKQYELKIVATKDAIITLSVRGDFFDKVSDGWFGYNYVLNKKIVPYQYEIIVSLRNEGFGKSERTMEELSKLVNNDNTINREKRNITFSHTSNDVMMNIIITPAMPKNTGNENLFDKFFQ